jgi:hypothetical protein
MTMPAWKLGKDVLFDKGSIRHSGATLVYMGITLTYHSVVDIINFSFKKNKSP